MMVLVLVPTGRSFVSFLVAVGVTFLSLALTTTPGSVAWTSKAAVTSFHRHGLLSRTTYERSTTTVLQSSATEVASVVPSMVRVLSDSDAVGRAVREIVRSAAEKAIQDHGYFTLAIPGGSILKMLIDDTNNKILLSSSSSDWTSKTVVVYVNHKCVAMDDVKLATHAKAQNMFLSQWKGTKVITLNGSSDGEAEAASYIVKLQEEVSKGVLETDPMGYPVFDLALVGGKFDER